jgi:hypothetical protein
MAIMEGNNGNETDLMQLWAVITELGEQLSQNRAMSVSLYGLAGNIKVWTIVHAPNRQYRDTICRTKQLIRKLDLSCDGVFYILVLVKFDIL